LEDGHVRTEREKSSAPFAIDVDLEHKTINERYDAPAGQQLANGSVSIGGVATKMASEHEPGYQDSISIDRLSGTAIVMHLHDPPTDCVSRLGHVPSCLTSQTTTTYHCEPAATDFPDPVPRMLRVWHRLRRSHLVSETKHVLRRLYFAVERRLSPAETAKATPNSH
jgi:hypothetical protein